MKRFSDRHGFAEGEAEITVRNDAPPGLRSAVIDISYESGFSPTPMRRLVCRVLREAPDLNNWSEYPNVEREVRSLISDCQWHRVYDIIEAAFAVLTGNGPPCEGARPNLDSASHFEDEINSYFVLHGIGWKLETGQIELRGSESFEVSTHGTLDVLSKINRKTAAKELREALHDLSRRPEPDATGAIQHAMAALECVARDVASDPTATLGAIIKRNPELIPAPLDTAVEKAWGYASNSGRHLQNGKEPGFEEAELIVGLTGVLCRYLARNLSEVK